MERYLRQYIGLINEANRTLALMEAIPYSKVKEYLKIKRDPKAESELKKLFNKFKSRQGAIQLDKKGYRIAFPYDLKKGSEGDDNQVESEVSKFISQYDYSLKDYHSGLAYDQKNKRDVKIGKLLNALSKKDKNTAEDLLNKFNKDPDRAQSSNKEKYYVVFSNHPYDIAGMSTGRDWTSCMSVISGSQRHYVSLDIEHGTFVGYIIKSDDTNIKNPIGRISIKPFYNIDKAKDSDFIFYPEEKTYGNIPNSENFIKFCDELLKDLQNIGGDYKRLGCLYSDGDRDMVGGISDEQFQKILYRGEEVSQYYVENLFSKDQLKLYIDMRLNSTSNISLEEYEFDAASKEQQSQYIDIKLERGLNLRWYEFEGLTKEQQQSYIDNILKKNERSNTPPEKIIHLQVHEWKVTSESQQQRYIKALLKKNVLPAYDLLNVFTKRQHDIYLDLKLGEGKFLTVWDLKVASKEQQQRHIDMRLASGKAISEYEYGLASKEQQHRSIGTSLETDNILHEQQWAIASKEQREYSNNIKLKKGHPLKDYEFEEASKEQKSKAIDNKLAVSYLRHFEFKVASKEQQQRHIKKKLQYKYKLNPSEYKQASKEQQDRSDDSQMKLSPF